MPGPLLLAPDNFTPAERTPWGGRKIAEYKRGLGVTRSEIIGESWELSVVPSFPSRLADGSRTLPEVLAEGGAAYLGAEAAAGRSGTALLMKWLDARERLSLQIHPSDDYAGLRASEAGKPESWYIVEAAEGAGLFLGFRPGVTRAHVASAIDAGAPLEPLLSFVPVAPGDFFLIEAGTPHAIGEGIMLVEPQHVVPGREGVTYRYFDWGRRYDAQGRPSPAGQPRELHLEHAFAVTRWDLTDDPAWLDGLRHRAGLPALSEPAMWVDFSGPTAPLSSRHLRVGRLAGTGPAALPPSEVLRGLTVLAGTVTVSVPGYPALTVARGQTAVVPPHGSPVPCDLRGGHAIAAEVVCEAPSRS